MELVSETTYKIYKNHRQEPYFTFLKEGKKSIEGRLYKGLYADIIPDDHIVVHSEDEQDSVEVVVVAVRKYKNFSSMLQSEPIQKILPDVDSVEVGVQRYREFYSEEKENEYGVVAIEVKLI